MVRADCCSPMRVLSLYGDKHYSRRGKERYWLLCVLLLYCEVIDIDMKLGDGMFSRKNKKKTYDVQVKAWKPKRVVTIARVSTYERAAEIRDGLTAIGFEVMISWKRDENDVI